ncbi:MAG: type IX secretion system membrane protein PorP/SprF [Bacteroidetes bacterium]|nr:type IX secretion system membrane protein PorP/SprF [Bacteroidota bacterium]
MSYSWAQDPQFSQFFSNQLYLAPSFAGASDRSRVSSAVRSQWLGISGPGGVFTTYYTAYDHYFSNFNSGLGVIFLGDVAGSASYGLTELSLIYSYNFRIFDVWYVRPGVSFIYGEYGLDYQELIFTGEVFSQSIENPVTEPNDKYIDANASMLIYSDRIWFGGTAGHLLAPQLESLGFDNNRSLGITLFAGGEIIKYSRLLKPIDETLNLAGQLRLYNTQKQFDVGLYWYKAPLLLGLWYRGIPVVNSKRGDALIPLIGYKNEWLYVGYSYDFTVSDLITNTYGSHEISINFKFNPPPKKQKLGAVPCPHF